MLTFEGRVIVSDLRRALDRAKHFTPKKTGLPILRCVKIHTTVINSKDLGLVITATDLDMSIEVDLPIYERKGTLKGCFHAGSMLNFLRTLDPRASAMLYLHSSHDPDATDILEISSGNCSCRFAASHKMEEFPVMSWNGDARRSNQQLDLDAFFIPGVLERIANFVSTEETRYYLNGILLCEHEGFVRAVATDGHRLGWIDTAVKAPAGLEMIIPNRLLDHLFRLKNQLHNAQFRYSTANRVCTFWTHGMVIRSRLIDGTFPDYQRVIPRGYSRHLSIKGRDAKKAVARVLAFAPHAKHSGSVVLTRNGKDLKLQYHRNQDGCELTESLAVQGDGLTGRLGMNAAYLKNIVHNQAGEDLFLSFPDNDQAPTDFHSDPVLITSTGDPLTAVLMPMRV